MIALSISPRRLTQLFASLVILLVVAHIVVQIIRFSTGDDVLYGAFAAFDLGSEKNFPTFYAALALLFSGLLLAAIGSASWQENDKDYKFWFVLAAIFAVLSVDEMIRLHEHLIDPFRSAFNFSGLLYYAWVVPYGLAGLALLLVYSRFLLRLPRRTAALMVIAGTVFVCGAIGMEMLGGAVSEAQGNENVLYVTLQTIEEMLEMIGIVIFIYALSSYIAERFGRLGAEISSG
ncbi:MAG: hypothetical protein ACR2P6_09215 [Gammaproteobacteria bacterium]